MKEYVIELTEEEIRSLWLVTGRTKGGDISPFACIYSIVKPLIDYTKYRHYPYSVFDHRDIFKCDYKL